MSTDIKEATKPIQFFGAVDRNKKGDIASQMPAYTFSRQIELMQEGIDQKKRALELGFVASDNEAEYKQHIARETDRMQEILDSKPRLNDSDRDLCAKTYKELRAGIKETLTTVQDEQRGFVRPHEEHRKNKSACIKITEQTVDMCEANGIPVSDKGEISRDNAVRLQMMIGANIDADTNIERMRKIK